MMISDQKLQWKTGRRKGISRGRLYQPSFGAGGSTARARAAECWIKVEFPLRRVLAKAEVQSSKFKVQSLKFKV